MIRRVGLNQRFTSAGSVQGSLEGRTQAITARSASPRTRPAGPRGRPVVVMMRAAPRTLTRTGAAPARCRSKGPPSTARRASPGALRAGRPLPGTRTSRPLPRVRWRLAANGARRATQPGSMRSRASGCAPAPAIPPRRRPLEALLHSAQEVAWRKSHTDRRSGWSACTGSTRRPVRSTGRSTRRSPSRRKWRSADRRVEDLDRMRRRQPFAAIAQDLLDLQGATGVGAGQQVRPRRENVVDLALPDLLRALRLHQVVDPRAPATLLAVGHLDQRDSRDAAEQLARLRLDALGVHQAAGVVHGDANLEGTEIGRASCRERV